MTLHIGDCLEVMAGMDAESVDAVVTDPPYGLSKHRPQRVMDGLLRALADIALPNLNETYAELLKQSDLTGVPLDGSSLTRRKLASVDAGVGVPEGAIYLDGGIAVGQVEVEAGGESSVSTTEVVLPNELDAEDSEFLGDYILDLRDARDASLRYGLGSRFAELGLGRVCVPVVLTLAPGSGSTLASYLLRHAPGWGHSVGLSDDAGGESEGTSAIVASARTVDRTMLRFDLSRGTLDLLATSSTGEDDRAALQSCAKLIGAGTAARGLSPELEPRRVGVVFDSANGTRPAYLHLWLRSGEDHRLESILPRGGFMGKSWDSVTPPADYWRAVYRVLKPSHYLLTFGGCRTHHRVMTALEDAGFELVDVLMWVFGSGFPKGRGQLKPAYEPVILARKPGPMRELGVDECRIGVRDESKMYVQPRATTDAGGASWSKGEHVPSHYGESGGRWPANLILDEEAGAALDASTGVLTSGSRAAGEYTSGGLCYGEYGDNERPALAGSSGGPSRFFYNAKSSSRERNAGVSGLFVTLELEVCPCGESTAQVTSLARAISEWATGQGSHGCSTSSCGSPSSGQYLMITVSTTSMETSKTTVSKTSSVWTTRPISESIADVLATLPACGISLVESAESLSRSLTTTSERAGSAPGARTIVSEAPLRVSASVRLQGNTHPTCKPLTLMRWLVKLVAREDETVLDPFTGSGTTGVACANEGRHFIGIEREAEYVEIARRRIEAARTP